MIYRYVRIRDNQHVNHKTLSLAAQRQTSFPVIFRAIYKERTHGGGRGSEAMRRPMS